MPITSPDEIDTTLAAVPPRELWERLDDWTAYLDQLPGRLGAPYCPWSKQLDALIGDLTARSKAKGKHAAAAMAACRRSLPAYLAAARVLRAVRVRLERLVNIRHTDVDYAESSIRRRIRDVSRDYPPALDAFKRATAQLACDIDLLAGLLHDAARKLGGTKGKRRTKWKHANPYSLSPIERRLTHAAASLVGGNFRSVRRVTLAQICKRANIEWENVEGGIELRNLLGREACRYLDACNCREIGARLSKLGYLDSGKSGQRGYLVTFKCVDLSTPRSRTK